MSGLLECDGPTPAAEVCDALDNDCDGSIDEDPAWANLGTACSVGTGECEAAGAYICDAVDPAGPTVCDATPGTPSAEVCDGLDDDCNGIIDEGAFCPPFNVCSAGQCCVPSGGLCFYGPCCSGSCNIISLCN